MFILVIPYSVEQLMTHSNLEGICIEFLAGCEVKKNKARQETRHETLTVSTGRTLETLFLFLPLAGPAEMSSRSPPPLTLLLGEVALLLLELEDIAR